MRVWQPGATLVGAGANVRDWSWAHDEAAALRRCTASRVRTGCVPRLASASCSARRRSRSSRRCCIGLAVNEVTREEPQTTTCPGSLGGFLAAGSGRCSRAATGQTYFTGWTGETMLADLRNHLFRHLQRLSLGFYERNRRGRARQPHHERRRGARPARHRRRHLAAPGHADDGRTAVITLAARLAARSRDADAVVPGSCSPAGSGALAGAVPQNRRVRERLSNVTARSPRHRRHARPAGVPPRARGRTRRTSPRSTSPTAR